MPGSSSAARAAVLPVLDSDNGMIRMVRSPWAESHRARGAALFFYTTFTLSLRSRYDFPRLIRYALLCFLPVRTRTTIGLVSALSRDEAVSWPIRNCTHALSMRHREDGSS